MHSDKIVRQNLDSQVMNLRKRLEKRSKNKIFLIK